MVVIGFFRDLLNSFSGLFNMVTTPLGEQFPEITVEPFKSSTMIGLLGVGIVATLGVLLVIHLIRLFIGG